MIYSPILQIPQVAPSQTNKETLINTATAILEAAANDAKVYNTTGLTSKSLTLDEFTRYQLHRLQGHSAALTLWVPDTKRFFIVSNEGTGAGAVTVKPNGSASGSATVPVGKIVMFQTDGDRIFSVSSGVGRLQDLSDVDFISAMPTDGMILSYVGSEGKWQPVVVNLGVSAFTDLSDVPGAYGGALKLVRVNAANNGLEFVTAPTPPFVPSQIGQLADVEDATSKTNGDILTWKDGVWQPEPVGSVLGAGAFTQLSDTPNSYTGLAGKMLVVNPGETGLIFVSRPFIPYQIGHLADVEDATSKTDGDVLTWRDGVWQPEPLSGLIGASSFLSLSDTPANYSGAGGKLVVVNAGATGLLFTPMPFIPNRLGHLGDVEDATSKVDGDILRYRDGVWQAEPFPSAAVATAFTSLSDVPASYTGNAGKMLVVNPAENALVYVPRPFIPYQIGHLADVEDSTSKADGDFLRYRNSIWQAEPPSRQPTPLYFWLAGKPTVSETIVVPFNVNTQCADDFAGSLVSVGTNATATAVFTLKRNGASIGTLSISTSGVGTFVTTGTGTETWTPSDTFSLVAPSPQDATLADVGITIAFTRLQN